MQNKKYSHTNVKNRCENKFNINFRGTKELNGWFIHDGKKITRITVSKGHSKKGISIGTYKSMAKQLSLTINEFEDFLKCPLKLNGYLKILKKLDKI